MIEQKINLLQGDLKLASQTSYLTSKNMLRGAACFLIVLMIPYFMKSGDLSGLEDQLADYQAENEKIHNTLAELESQSNKSMTIAKLEKEMFALKAQESSVNENLNELLKREELNHGFSHYLSGFANQHVTGIWLENIRVIGKSKDIQLTGYTIKPELVLELIQKLSHETIFAGKKFNKVDIAKADEAGQPMRFEISTRANFDAEEDDQ